MSIIDEYRHWFLIYGEGTRSEIISWCHDNLKGTWYKINTVSLHILIDDDREAMWFKLLWSDHIRKHKVNEHELTKPT